jgi:hypothetical protein
VGWARLADLVLRLAHKAMGAWERHKRRRAVARRRRAIKEERHAIDRDPAGAGRRLFGMQRDNGRRRAGDGGG